MSTPGPSRREEIAALRETVRIMRRRTMIPKMFAAGLISNQVLAWTLMIMTGIAHGSWWRTVPTMSYHAASLLTGFLFIGIVAVIITIQTARELS